MTSTSTSPTPSRTPRTPSRAGLPGSSDRAPGLHAQASDPALTVSLTHPDPGVAVVRAIGEIDLLTAPGWAQILHGVCLELAAQPSPPQPSSPCPSEAVGQGQRPAPRLVCDLSGVGFLGACGLGVLVELAEHADRLGVALRVVAEARPVRRILELTALDRVLPIEPVLLPVISAPAGPQR